MPSPSSELCLAAEALLRSPRLDQRSVDGEVLIAHETLGQRLSTNVTKTAALDSTVKTEQSGAPKLSKVSNTITVHEYNIPDSRLAAAFSECASRIERSVIVAPNRAERDELTQLDRADL